MAVCIYIATSSGGKLRDFRAAARRSGGSGGEGGVEMLPLPGIGVMAAPAEDELTFAGNARVKALAYARAAVERSPELAGALLLADDSGLEVDGLGGEPGVRSARYADDFGYDPAPGLSTDERNNRLLLQRLGGSLPRTARYRCALAVVRCGGDPELVAEADGTLEGEILREGRGTGGFGYDPLFLVREAGRTMAELGKEERLEYSHRGRALRRLLERMGVA